MKYHIDKKGVPAVCKANKRKCPLGGVSGDENHYSSIEEAQAAIDRENLENFELLPNSDLNLSPSAHQKIKTQIVVTKQKIDKNKFVIPAENNGRNKPSIGGFWTSTLNDNGMSDWMSWTKSEEFYSYSKGKTVLDTATIQISENANVLTIDNREDYEKIIEKYKEKIDEQGEVKFVYTLSGPEDLLDFNLLSKDYDGIRLTQKGIHENKKAFEFWDVESTLWFNLDNFETIDYEKGGYKE